MSSGSGRQAGAENQETKEVSYRGERYSVRPGPEISASSTGLGPSAIIYLNEQGLIRYRSPREAGDHLCGFFDPLL